MINREKAARLGRPALTDEEIRRGRPSYIWQFGQQRRLDLVKKYLSLKNKRILDVGCGLGTYLKKFQEESPEVYGLDIDSESIKEASKISSKVQLAKAEKLPYSSNFFHLVFMHEILEHLEDDKKAISEALRVLKPKGNLVIFAPNRFWFFETHGFFLGKKYIFRLLPFVNWLPAFIRNKFCPHVRIYTRRKLKKLFEDENVEFRCWYYLYPGFDKITYRHPSLGKILRKIFYFLEKTPLQIFGLSIFTIVKKK